MTITAEGWTPDVITLWCHECLLPAGHPQASDPVSWCDCGPDETCTAHTSWSCRRRAHDPDECHRRPTYPHHEGYDAAADSSHPITAAAEAAGTFDRTMDLSDLRDLIEQALDTETLDALYDAHCRVEEGGDGLWTDDLTPIAQAAYDRVSGQQQGAES